MRFLLSNDDGFRAPGLACLAEALGHLGEVVVVAPDRNRSGASNSLTLDTPVRVTREPNGFHSVTGTPTDCVHLALRGLLAESFDMVLSGINEGANLGDDVLYSGTVAAAMEGRFLGLPAMAVSLVGERPVHYATAAELVRGLLERHLPGQLPPDTLLNVNVPDLPAEALRGVRVTRLGQRHKSEPALHATDPKGRPVYWIGPPGAAQDAGPGTDFDAVREGYASITPLSVDLTRYSAMDNVKKWLQGVDLRNV